MERKQKLIKYLFPTEEIRSFMCNDLYMELMEQIPRFLCISSKNITNSVRKENFEKVNSIITNFIENNENYKQMLKKLFSNKELKNIISDIVIGYVFFITQTNLKYNHIDIFRDKKSICYSPISIIDIL